MNAKITLLLALAMVAISAISAQQYDAYLTANQGPSNKVLARTDVRSGVQRSSNQNSSYASNKNVGKNIKSKANVENDLVAQKEKSVTLVPTYVPAVAPVYAPAPVPVYSPAPAPSYEPTPASASAPAS